MGITIHYRGTIDDLSQVETMEDRLLDLIFSLSGRATIWRSFAEHDSSRVVRGLIVQLEPGQESFSLLVSPEGHLTPLLQIQEAEEIPFDEPPCCFVKTQFGSLQGHIAIVHLLDALQQRFFSNLEVSDEGGYYDDDDDDHFGRALTISQLKRALSGHAYARGALLGLRSEGIISNEKSNELFQQLELILANIHELSAKAWGSET
jgi:hypothetical protein